MSSGARAGADDPGAGLLRALLADGHLTPDWADAWRAVDREAFVPDRVWVRTPRQGYERFDRASDPARWRALVHSDTVLVTQVEGGGAEPEFSAHPTSSASMPRIVAGMLGALAAEEGHRVLEVGTGVGISAALLAERLGGDAVTSVELDPRVAAAAAESLKRAGYHPYLVVGDGTAGVPERAPFDRVLCTCSVRTVPWAWVAQTRVGGRIVTPWGSSSYNGVLLVLDVAEDADGRYAAGRVHGDVSFMWERGQAAANWSVCAGRCADAAPDEVTGGVAGEAPGDTSHETPDDTLGEAPGQAPDDAPDDARGVRGTTTFNPWPLAADRDAAFAMGLLAPGIRRHIDRPPGDSGPALDTFDVWLVDEDRPRTSRARIRYVPGADGFEVERFGPRDLVAEARRVLSWWESAERPARSRYGVTVRESGQVAWLDDPGTAIGDRNGTG